MSKRVGQWLLWIGIASQVLPLLGMQDALIGLLGYRHAQIGLLISMLGGFLSGFGSARRLPSAAKVAGATRGDATNAHASPTPSAKATPPRAIVAPPQPTTKPTPQPRRALLPVEEKQNPHPPERFDKRLDTSRPTPKQASAVNDRDAAKTKSRRSSAAPKKRTAKPADSGQVVVATDQDAATAAPRQLTPTLAKPAPATRRPASDRTKTTREKAPLSLVLVGVGPRRDEVIDAIRERTGMTWKEVVGLVDRAPATIGDNVSVRQARALKAQLEALGAAVELR
jgi:large subunit ribosomal protein L7/L12